jgi:hypothetical protein
MSKRPWQSKINWLGLMIALLGLVLDPQFQARLEAIIPRAIVSDLVSIAGLVVIVIRTCCTSQNITMGEKKE